MKVSITGTPGTGKTTIAKKLDNNFEVVHLTKFIKEHGLGNKDDKGVEEVDIDRLNKEFDKKYGEKDNILVEGHLSHFLNTEYCIVLRCSPEKLEERLKERDYSESKIRENIEAEMIDRILLESVNMKDKVFELDTTEKPLSDTKRELEAAIEGKKEDYGNISWL